MVQLVSTPLSNATPPQRRPVYAHPGADLGSVFGAMGEDILLGGRRPEVASAPVAPGMSGSPSFDAANVSSGPTRLASPEIAALIEKTATEYGIDPKAFARFAHIESGGDPRARTGSYSGLFQLGPAEWARYGGGGNIFDPQSNARAAAAKLVDEKRDFTAKHGREPSISDLYMVHQQGPGGYAAHTANPDAPAWQNMASTGEGRQKGPGWARQAIWGNIPAQYRSQFGSVDNVTSRQFMDMWKRKVGL